jgi:hypothetical protein
MDEGVVKAPALQAQSPEFKKKKGRIQRALAHGSIHLGRPSQGGII